MDKKPDDLNDLKKLHQAYEKICEEMREIVVGQDEVVEQLLTSIFARGHCILEGVPGLAKTLMVSTLAQCLSLSFKRIQFTPDLMPSDITGTDVLQEDQKTGERIFTYIKGPIFANIVLGDEINRAPPKTQAALLEAMQEHQVSAGGQLHRLPEPFFVLATMNPIEQEGTYSLPEAQLDRFMMKAVVQYPSFEEEREIYRLPAGTSEKKLEPVVSGEEIIEIQKLVSQIPISDYALDYTIRVVRSTRRADELSPEFIRKWVGWGAGPRAGQSLIKAARARAGLRGLSEVGIDDIRAVAVPVLRHRLMLNYTAEAENQTHDGIIQRLLDSVPENSSQEALDAGAANVLKS